MEKQARSSASEGWSEPAGTAGSAPSWGQLLQRYRTLARLTQEQLAERSGYSVDYISKLERDLRHPPLVAVDRFTAALELDDTEGEELRAAHQRRGAAQPHPGARPLAGRDVELAEIRRQLAGLGPPVLLLAGEPGIGKTRLLEDVEPHASSGGWRVVRGGCQRWAQDPYAPLTDALARSIEQLPEPSRGIALQGADWLGLLLPELATEGGRRADRPDRVVNRQQTTLGPEQERRLLFAAAANYLRAVAGKAGTLLVLDDLHWAGADALDLLAALVSSRETPPVRLLGAYRDTEMAADAPLARFLADLASDSLARVLSLGPLSEAAAGQLVAGLVGDDERRAAIVRRAGGVPFFLVSFGEDLPRQSAEAQLEPPWTVTQVIRQRAAALPESVRELLGVAAVTGRIIPRVLLCQVTGRDEEEVLSGLEAAATARLLEEDEEGGYRFTHDLIQEAIESDLSAGRRQLLHRRIGEALEQDEQAAVESLAFHFARSDDPIKALLYLERAGDEAEQRVAHAAAVGFYREAVTRRLRAGQTQEAAPIEEKLGTALHLTGQYDAAITALERALASYRAAGDQEGVQRVAGRLGEAHFRRGTGHDALAHVEALVQDDASDRADGGSRGAVDLRAGLVHLLFAKGAYRQMVTAGRALAQLGRATRNARIRAMGERVEGVGLIFLGRPADGIALLEPALSQGLATGDRERVVEVATAVCGTYLAMGSLERSEALSRQMLPLAESLNDPVLIATHTLLFGAVLHIRGDWERARSYLERGAELFASTGPSFSSVSMVAVRAACLIWEGRWEEARGYLEVTLQLARSMRYRLSEHHALIRLAELDVLEGRPKSAVARLEPLATSALESRNAVPLLSTIAQAYLEANDGARAEPLAERAVAEARQMGTWLEGIAALRVRGMVATRQGNFDLARNVYEEGLQRARSMPFPYGEAQLLYALGLLQRQHGNDGPATQDLEAALSTFRRLGARRDVERVRAVIGAG